MSATRRQFLEMAGAAALASAAAGTAISQTRPPSPATSAGQAGQAAGATVRPPRLKPGDTIGLIEPASATFEADILQISVEVVEAMGFKARLAPHADDRYGYLAGKDEDRARDVNQFFADPTVNAVMAVRGGWGCARLLPHIDFATIAKNPKILVGYSDLTALLLAVHARTGLVTFHGPMGVSTWNAFNLDSFRRVLVGAEAVTFENVREIKDTLVQVDNRIQTITPGLARGRLLGGNLTVLAGIVGSGYLPDFSGAILFVEEVEESIYRVDRLLTQLALAGILGRLRGVVFGHCTKCLPGDGYGSLTLDEVLRDHIRPLGVPAWSGAMIGHISRQFTMPIGSEVEIDATKGTIRMIEPAVG
jgi:muramoyltetrapeptide carboxypeptidase